MKEKILGVFIYIIFRIICHTYRLKLVSADHYQQLLDKRQNMIYALSHGRMFTLLYFTRKRPIITMASLSSDGRLIARVLALIGYKIADGSSSRGGVGALIDMIHQVKGGQQGAITIDGPRGPVFTVKPGVIQLAKKTGAAILPLTYSANRAFIFKRSWDSFMLPFPFATCYISYGDPINVPKDLKDEHIEKYCKNLEQQLHRQTNLLDNKYLNPESAIKNGN